MQTGIIKDFQHLIHDAHSQSWSRRSLIKYFIMNELIFKFSNIEIEINNILENYKRCSDVSGLDLYLYI